MRLRSLLVPVVAAAALLLPSASAQAALQLYPVTGLDLPELANGSGPLKFDFKPYKLATRYDGQSCKFALRRIDQQTDDIGVGEFSVDGGHLKFAKSRWLTGGLATPESFDRANLALTDKGEVVGRLPIFDLFISPGMVTPDAKLVTLVTKDGKLGKDLPVGAVTLDIDNSTKGEFAVIACNPGTNGIGAAPPVDFSSYRLASRYTGFECRAAIAATSDGKSKLLGNGTLRFGPDGDARLADGYWHVGSTTVPESFDSAKLAVTEAGELVGTLAVLAPPATGDGNSSPEWVVLEAGGTPLGPETPEGKIALQLSDARTGTLTIRSCTRPGG